MGSALLAPGTRAAWELIQRSEGGTARLLRGFEAYFSNVARNARRTYLRPFVIVTANMSEGRGLARGAAGPHRRSPGFVWGARPQRGFRLGSGRQLRPPLPRP